ncbi:DNA/RNA non-specific endonuclease [Acetobacteraceae bacterium]|nr:DNA/RNA non-specific endonuclease [Acetobacteraceae bacterium]
MPENSSFFSIFRAHSFCLFTFSFLLLLSHKSFAQCPRFAAAGEFPTAGEVICNDNYAVGYSSSRRSPLWAAEHLTPEQAKASQNANMPKIGITKDPRLNQSAALTDYQDSPWKPLALAPTEDMSSPKAKQQSAFISNIIPSDPTLKQKTWKTIEENTRKIVTEYGGLNVLTGVIFGDSPQFFGKNRAKLPEKIWKIIYVPRQGTAAVICNNAAPLHCVSSSVQEIENLCYIGLFPGVSESEINSKLNPAHWPGL